MRFSKTTILFFVLIFDLAIVIGCINWSSSSTLRYQSNNNDSENGKSNNELTSQNTSEDSSFIYNDEDVPEYQDPSDLPEDESKIDLSSLMKNLKNESKGSGEEAVLSSKKELMIMEIIKYMNTPYKYGGNSLNGIDCSAFTQSVYQSSWMITLNRSARDQYQQGTVIENREDLKFGDLIFFNTRRRVRPGHVGIYIGENLFAHASSTLGVTISSLEHNYYNKRYMGARRIEEEETN
jgi:cell wall-associated NlpC family hydrolase